MYELSFTVDKLTDLEPLIKALETVGRVRNTASVQRMVEPEMVQFFYRWNHAAKIGWTWIYDNTHGWILCDTVPPRSARHTDGWDLTHVAFCTVYTAKKFFDLDAPIALDMVNTPCKSIVCLGPNIQTSFYTPIRYVDRGTRIVLGPGDAVDAVIDLTPNSA